jgi:hypothetical protein
MDRWSETELDEAVSGGDAEVRETPYTSGTEQSESASADREGVVLRLEIEADVPSLNDYYAGEHWSERKKTRDQFHLLVKSKAPNVHVEEYPVSVDCEVRFGDGRKQLDSVNTAAVCKVITDGLQECGVLDGDSPEYVREVTLRSIMHDGPTTVVYRLLK